MARLVYLIQGDDANIATLHFDGNTVFARIRGKDLKAALEGSTIEGSDNQRMLLEKVAEFAKKGALEIVFKNAVKGIDRDFRYVARPEQVKIVVGGRVEYIIEYEDKVVTIIPDGIRVRVVEKQRKEA